MNNFEVVQNLEMIFHKVDFISFPQLAFRTKLFSSDLCLVWNVVSRIF